ncbi:MAG: hypothetical protein U0W24_06370 [Bacteroidales bacterium]
MQGKYHLLSISVLLSIIYFLSFFASRTGIISKKLHSKSWNLILLLSFSIAGLTGFFMAIQVNYKINISFIDSITLFHVDFGIALFLIALFHILLHLNYFRNIFESRSAKSGSNQMETNISYPETKSYYRVILFSLLILGITSIITQIIFYREFISVFAGNELLLGMLLSIWLILVGTGSFVAKKISQKWKVENIHLTAHLLIGILPVFTLFGMLALRNSVFEPGVQVDYIELFVFTFFLLLPFCLSSGFMFALLCSMLSGYSTNQSGALAYSLESAGSLAGGFIFSFILVFIFSGFQILMLILLINLAVVFYIRFEKPGIMSTISLVLFLALIVFLGFSIDIDRFAKGFLFQNQSIQSIHHSPYGQIIVTENSGQLNFYQNGGYLFSSDSVWSVNANFATDEEMVHFTLVQHPESGNILFITNGLCGAINEILKYPIKSIDVVEIDPEISKMAKTHNSSLANKKVRLINADARNYLKKNDKKYDVVIIDVPPPSGTETNRFFTLDFFHLLHKRMSPTSYLSISLPSTVNYPDEFSLIINRVLYNTLRNNFKETKIFTGEKNYFIASDNEINDSIVKILTAKGIQTEYVGYYLDDASLISRSKEITRKVSGESALNLDLKPVSYLLFIRQQWNIFKGSYYLTGLFILILVVLVFRTMNKVRFVMFSAGFASITAELSIIYMLQMVYGNTYYYTSLAFTVFMAGLSLGPWLPNRFSSSKKVYFSPVILGIIIALNPWILQISIRSDLPNAVNYILFFGLIFIVAFLTGFIFKQITTNYQEKVTNLTGSIYSADLFGSAIGAILVSMLFIPVLGVLWSGIPGLVLCGLAAIWICFK